MFSKLINQKQIKKKQYQQIIQLKKAWKTQEKRKHLPAAPVGGQPDYRYSHYSSATRAQKKNCI